LFVGEAILNDMNAVLVAELGFIGVGGLFLSMRTTPSSSLSWKVVSSSSYMLWAFHEAGFTGVGRRSLSLFVGEGV